MKHFDGKIVMITGASRGLGKAMAREFASQGATLILHASKKTPAATQTLKEIRILSPQSQLYYADFTKNDDIIAMTHLIQKALPRIDILINNAGAIYRKILLDVTDKEYDEVFRVNIYGTYSLTKYLLPSIIRSTHGRIINMSSICGITGEYGLSAYCASKAAIIGFTKSLAKEIGKYNITVNAICPGFTDAGMANDIERAFFKKSIHSVPLRRAGKKEEVAKLAAFLCSDDAAYITGQAISINGGLV